MTVTEQLDVLIGKATQANQLLRMIHADLGGAPLPPEHLSALVKKGLAMKKFRIPGSPVNVLFTWDAASDGGVTTNYSLVTTRDSDGQIMSSDSLGGSASSFLVSLQDDNQPYTGTLTAFNSAGQPCPVPATVAFVPHTDAPPPPLPGNPTNLSASVS